MSTVDGYTSNGGASEGPNPLGMLNSFRSVLNKICRSVHKNTGSITYAERFLGMMAKGQDERSPGYHFEVSRGALLCWWHSLNCDVLQLH